MITTSQTKFNWFDELDKDWVDIFTQLNISDYSNNLNTFIEQVYLQNKEVYPVQDRLFDSFNRCYRGLDFVKVVIIDDNPVKDLRSSGIGRGLIEPSFTVSDLPIELRQFRDCICETIFGNQCSLTNFDNSLYDYSLDEDILFLNSSLCVEKDRDYSKVWRPFIIHILQELNKRKENIAYVFLTGNNSDLYKYIDQTKNKIIVNPTSVLMSYSTIFNEIDNYLSDNKIKSINW